MLQLHQTYSPLHSTFIGNGRFIDILGEADGWRAIEVGLDGRGGTEIAVGGSMEEALAAAERALSCF